MSLAADPMSPSRSSRNVPATLGPYQMILCLGEGGFAPVWHAEEVYQGRKLRDVAIKLFFVPAGLQPVSDEASAWLDNVIDEARALCRVEHANIVRFHALHRDDPTGVVGLVMEYVPGRNLGKLLRDEGPLSERRILDVGVSVAWALAAVHEAGLVHRDIKPENIIQAASGYKLIDFGIVTSAPEEPGPEGVPSPPLVGTRGFIAPEYILDRAPPSAVGDLYALGATLFLLKNGTLPPLGSGAPASPDAPGVASLDELTHVLLDPDPATRPRHADWVARELERLRERLDGPPATRPALAVTAGPSVELATLAPASTGTLRAVPGKAPGRAADATALEETVFEPNPHPPLVGRDAELRALEKLALLARQGPRLALVSGPLGIGRTRLIEEAIARAGIAPDRTLRLHGSPGRQSPLRPFVLGLRALRGGELFHLVGAAVERALSPALLPAPGQADEAIEAIEDALVGAAADEPVLLVVDDVQWADERTLKLLQLLVERTEHGRAKLLVLVSSRDEPHASAPLRAFLGAVKGRVRAGVRHFALGPMTPEQAALVAQGVCPVEPDVERAAVRGSGGVPFFLVNALLAWRETGAIGWRERAYHAVDEAILSGEVPGVGALVEARLATYFEPESPAHRAALRVLAAVALHGDGLPVDVVLDVCGATEGAERAMETLVGAGMLAMAGEPPEYGFAQEMVRQAVLNLARPQPWLHRLHRLLLDTIARRPDADDDAAFLAVGYEKLGARDEARTWLSRAVERALSAGLFADAAAFGDRLAALAGDATARMDAAIGSVRALVRGRHVDEAKQRLARLDAGSRDVRLRILRLEAARARSEIAEDPDLLAEADALSDPALACDARMALAGVAPRGEAVALASEAVALAERLDPTHEFWARVLRAELLYAAELADVDLLRQDLERALAIARATSSPWQQVHIEGDLAVIEAEQDHLDSAIEWLRRLAQQAEAAGMKGQLRTLQNNLAAFLLRRGSFAEAAAVAQRTATLAADAGDPTLRAAALSLRADALFHVRALDEALESLDEAEHLQRERDDRVLSLTLLRRAEVLAAMGSSDAALDASRAAQEAAELHEERGFLVTAILWEKLHLARRGRVAADELREALTAAREAGVGNRPLTRRLIEDAAAELDKGTARVVS